MNDRESTVIGILFLIGVLLLVAGTGAALVYQHWGLEAIALALFVWGGVFLVIAIVAAAGRN
jgi:hypothetical protein